MFAAHRSPRDVSTVTGRVPTHGINGDSGHGEHDSGSDQVLDGAAATHRYSEAATTGRLRRASMRDATRVMAHHGARHLDGAGRQGPRLQRATGAARSGGYVLAAVFASARAST